MKFKKTLAAVAAVAMAASAVSAFAMGASAIEAGSTIIDFEDGDCSFVYMNDYDGGSTATISVEDFNGSKALKIDPDDGSLYSKVWFDLDSIVDRSTATQIYTIEFDVTVVPDGDGIVGWVAGNIGSAGGFDKDDIQSSQKNPAWSQADVEIGGGAYDPGVSASGHGTKKFLLSSTQYTEDGTNPFFCFMLNPGSATDRAEDGAYTADYSIYIDNIVLSSKEGALPLGVTAAEETEAEETEAAETETAETEAAETEAAETEAAVDEAPVAEEEVVVEEVEEVVVAEEETVVVTEAAVVETAPAVTTTTAASTGNTSALAIAGIMAAAGAVAFATKKSK